MRRWKTSTHTSNAPLLQRYLVPFSARCVSLKCGLDSIPGAVLRQRQTDLVCALMMQQAELWELHPQRSHPNSNLRR